MLYYLGGNIKIMFRHRVKHRTYIHNLIFAPVFFICGRYCKYLWFSISEDSYNKFKRTLCILLVDLFISGLLVEVVDKKNFVIFYTLTMLIEIIIIIIIMSGTLLLGVKINISLAVSKNRVNRKLGG
ncbi:Uncharacterised protein [Elizabethkingia meningoseptica]|nr:Uncharacterised protein [Elizabethkingia meningoseptica]